MNNLFERNVSLWGEKAQQQLKNSTVAVFGLGGVGCACVEALARAGVGKLVLCDSDKYCLSNVNRQLFATLDVVGQDKTEVAKKRIAQINPDCVVETFCCRFDESTAFQFDFSKYHYVCDAIDSVKSKVLLSQKCLENGAQIVCSMGTGNKLDATKFSICDVSKTTTCPLAKAFRKNLKQVGIVNGVKVVYSTEEPKRFDKDYSLSPASCSFVPNVAGLLLAQTAICHIIKESDID